MRLLKVVLFLAITRGIYRIFIIEKSMVKPGNDQKQYTEIPPSTSLQTKTLSGFSQPANYQKQERTSEISYWGTYGQEPTKKKKRETKEKTDKNITEENALYQIVHKLDISKHIEQDIRNEVLDNLEEFEEGIFLVIPE